MSILSFFPYRSSSWSTSKFNLFSSLQESSKATSKPVLFNSIKKVSVDSIIKSKLNLVNPNQRQNYSSYSWKRRLSISISIFPSLFLILFITIIKSENRCNLNQKAFESFVWKIFCHVNVYDQYFALSIFFQCLWIEI